MRQKSKTALPAYLAGRFFMVATVLELSDFKNPAIDLLWWLSPKSRQLFRHLALISSCDTPHMYPEKYPHGKPLVS